MKALPRRWTAAGRVLLSLGLLVLLAWTVDLGTLARRLSGLERGWVVAALVLSVLQVVVSAWRWKYTARRVGVTLPLGAAVREYYLATFLNQLLPGGIVGDVSRAWRHARGDAVDTARAVHAVVVERASGQVVMVAVAIVSAAVLLAPAVGGPVGPVVVVGALGAMVVALWSVLRTRARGAPPGSFLASLDRALLAPDALPVQLATSVAVVGSYLATFAMAAWALGIETSLARLLPLVAPVLVTMLLPVTVAGWGLREAAAAALWGTAGLTPADGVAISVTYGLIVLVGSTPGVLVLAFRRRRTDPRRRPDPSPTAHAAPGDAAPR